MTHGKLFAATLVFLFFGCGGYKNVSSYTKQKPTSANELAPAAREASATGEFTNDDVNSMVAAVQSNDPQDAVSDEKSFNEAMAPEQDEAAFADSEMAADIEASFAKNNNAKGMEQIKVLVKNLAAAAKKGKRQRTKNIAVQLLKTIEKRANQGQAKAKDQKVKVSELVKMIVDAANKNKKADLKKSVEDLVKLLNS